MKQTAVDVNVPVLLVSQTSRSNSKEKRELEVSDLRGSGAIEEDAAAVFLLFEDKEDTKNALAIDGGRRYAQGPLKTYLKVGKNRYGMQGVYLALLHFKSLTRFDIVSGTEPPDDGEIVEE
jgi:replicative DNA helicase